MHGDRVTLDGRSYTWSDDSQSWTYRDDNLRLLLVVDKDLKLSLDALWAGQRGYK